MQADQLEVWLSFLDLKNSGMRSVWVGSFDKQS